MQDCSVIMAMLVRFIVVPSRKTIKIKCDNGIRARTCQLDQPAGTHLPWLVSLGGGGGIPHSDSTKTPSKSSLATAFRRMMRSHTRVSPGTSSPK
jgi:hypothetical protein